MIARLGTASPRTMARLTGVVYQLLFATATAVMEWLLTMGVNSQRWTEEAA